MDIYQCTSIEVLRSDFVNNGPVNISREGQYRGHAGGLSIGYTYINDNDDDDPGMGGNVTMSVVRNDSAGPGPGAWIDQCKFLNNTSNGLDLDSGQTLEGTVFPGRGGALTVAIDSPFEFNVVISSCEVIGNTAQAFGGGIYLVFSGYNPHFTTVNNTVFIDNTSKGSGGLSLGYVEGSEGGESVKMDVYDCYFRNNSGAFGGGIYIYADSEFSSSQEVVRDGFTGSE